MKKTLITFILVVSVTTIFAQNKRGLCYGYHSPQDLEVLSPEVSWWYNWSITPETSVADVFGDYGFDFVPMTWNGNYDETKLRNYLTNHPETKYILAFNEPNFLEQANMTPSEVAAAWPRLEAIADDFDLEIVAPAVNFCGECVTENGTTYTDPFEYLDDFFEACPDCRVDHIAVHSYMNTASALEWYIGEFKKYNKPIWLTEFAGWEYNGNINSIDDQINFMIGAVDFLESDPDVFRYSWFIGRGSGINTFPHIDILGANGELTKLGEVYKNMPVHNPQNVVDIPARIEAEAYNTMKGILLEKTSDITGNINVGYIESNDWLEYKINVTETKTYNINFRVASTKSTGFDILIDNSVVLSQSITNTGGWQNWKTFINSINLTAGTHTFRLKATNSGFNINWIEIEEEETTDIGKEKTNDDNFNIYPNPSNGVIYIDTKTMDCTVEIFNLLGKKIVTQQLNSSINVSSLANGIYILKTKNKQGETIAIRKISVKNN